jgi:hypothetical protein
MPTASSATAHAAPKTTTHATASATTHATAATAHATAATAHATPETAMHASAEAGLAAEGVLVYRAAVVESAECAGVAAPLNVRRDESAIGSMVETPKIIVMTSKTLMTSKTVTTSKPFAETVPAVYKSVTP